MALAGLNSQLQSPCYAAQNPNGMKRIQIQMCDFFYQWSEWKRMPILSMLLLIKIRLLSVAAAWSKWCQTLRTERKRNPAVRFNADLCRLRNINTHVNWTGLVCSAVWTLQHCCWDFGGRGPRLEVRVGWYGMYGNWPSRCAECIFRPCCLDN